VYADLKDKVIIEGKEVFTLDILNPPGTFRNGIRVHPWTAKNLLPISGKLIPEFDRRRNIRDMFSRKPSLATSPSSNGMFPNGDAIGETSQPTPAHHESLVEHSKPFSPTATAHLCPRSFQPRKTARQRREIGKRPRSQQQNESKIHLSRLLRARVRMGRRA